MSLAVAHQGRQRRPGGPRGHGCPDVAPAPHTTPPALRSAPSGRGHHARRRLSALATPGRRPLSELFGTEIAVGTVDAIVGRSGAALREPQKRLRDAVRDASVVCVDETGWKQAGETRFLWGAFTDSAAALRVAPSRHREEAEALLGESEAIVSSDRWWAYRHLDPARRQLCWSHLLVKTRYHRGLARNLSKAWPGLWTFLEAEGVEPTSNRAERGLRHAVIYRKLSQGSRCERGALATERLLSSTITCRLQGRPLFAYLVEVAQASIRGQPAPALV